MPRDHIIPSDIFLGLAKGYGAEPAIRLLLASHRSKQMLLLRLVASEVSAYVHPDASQFVELYESLRQAHTLAPSAVDPLMHYSSIGAWAIRTFHNLRAGSEIDYRYLAGLAISANVLAGTQATIQVAADSGDLFLPFLGRATFRPQPSLAVHTVNGRMVLEGESHATDLRPSIRRDTHNWQAIREIFIAHATMATSFLLDDLDPYRLPGSRTAPHLADSQLAQWNSKLASAWHLLVEHHTDVAVEVDRGTRVIVPLLRDRGGRVSATSHHSFGTVGLSEPVDHRYLALDLSHERQHAKLSALLDLVSLVRADSRYAAYAPWRDDPRPVGALLHGAYAHLGVADFWRRQRHVETVKKSALTAHTQFARWRSGTYVVTADLLRSGLLTEFGRTFASVMLTTIGAWKAEDVPYFAKLKAATANSIHRLKWIRHNGKTIRALST